jgi:hypothetical protein
MPTAVLMTSAGPFGFYLLHQLGNSFTQVSAEAWCKTLCAAVK